MQRSCWTNSSWDMKTLPTRSTALAVCRKLSDRTDAQWWFHRHIRGGRNSARWSAIHVMVHRAPSELIRSRLLPKVHSHQNITIPISKLKRIRKVTNSKYIRTMGVLKTSFSYRAMLGAAMWTGRKHHSVLSVISWCTVERCFLMRSSNSSQRRLNTIRNVTIF